MTSHRLFNATLAAAIVAAWMLLNAALDGPSDLDAIQATADSVTDAQAAAAAAARDAHFTHPTHLAAQDRP